MDNSSKSRKPSYCFKNHMGMSMVIRPSRTKTILDFIDQITYLQVRSYQFELTSNESDKCRIIVITAENFIETVTLSNV